METTKGKIITSGGFALPGENPHSSNLLSKEALGLGNVDNTADADKPLSLAVIAALDIMDMSMHFENQII